MRNPLTLAVVLTASLLSACGGGEEPRVEITRPEDEERDTLARAPLTDAGIYLLVSLVNGSEIGAAQVAVPKLWNPEVRAYAEMLLADHTAMSRAAAPLVAALKVDSARMPPQQYGPMQEVSQSQAGTINRMPTGPSYDSAFVALQVQAHAMALDSLRRWGQAARFPGLQSAIAAALPRVQAHLDRARALQARLVAVRGSYPVAPPPPDTGWIQRLKQASVPYATATADTLTGMAAPPPPDTVPW